MQILCSNNFMAVETQLSGKSPLSGWNSRLKLLDLRLRSPLISCVDDFS